LLWPHRPARWAALLGLAAWLGLARSLLALPAPLPPADSLRALNVPAVSARHAVGAALQVRGTVLADPVIARGGTVSQVRVAVATVWQAGAWRPVTGGLLALAGPYPGVGQGDLVECRGVVQDPPPVPGFDYRAWLARHGVESYMSPADVRLVAAAGDAPGDLLARWRRAAGARTATLLPEPEAGLLRGILLGQPKAIDPALRQDFATSGTSWIIVISGIHFSMLLLFGFLALRRWLAPWPSVALAGGLVVLYAAFVGLGVPVARAALMGALYLLAQGLGRPVTRLNLLAVAALALTALDPGSVADAGFQLSFGAVAGILLFAPPLSARWRRLPVLGEACAVGVAVQLATWPLVALQFGQFAPVALPAGVLGGLLLAPIMALGSLTELVSWLWAPLGQGLALVCWLPLTLLAHLVPLAAGLPLASLPLPDFGLPGALLWYTLLAAGYARASYKKRARPLYESKVLSPKS
ncbi:MAG TPA: ComEC/Rec2 family competence protein, partial [Chloroflexia bacterium]|nr:ComEC/Rec2 family competence protein [Chloroflexia bacterium]